MRPWASIAAEPGFPLLEREEALARLTAALDRARAGSGGTAVIEAPAGMGKTTLLAAAGRLGAERHMRVLSARAADTEREFGFGVVRQLLEPAVRQSTPAERDALFEGTAGAVRGLLDPAAARPPEQAPDALLHGLYWLVAALAEPRPVLLVADDVHWADALSLKALLFLAHRVPELPVLMLAAMRPREPGTDMPLAASLAADAGVERIELDRLSGESVRTLVRETLGAEPEDPFARACADASGGNPFLLRELLRELARAGVRPVAGEVPRIAGVQPASVVRTVLLRLARLPAAAAEVARAVAVLERAPFEQVAELAGVDRSTADELVDELVEAGIVTADGDLAFAHPMLRDVVYGDLRPRDRIRRHAAAARVLRRLAAPPERVAAHLHRTDAPLEPDDAAVLRRAAAEALQRGAPDAAAASLRRIAASPGPPAPFDLLLELGHAEMYAGNPAAAIETLQRARPLAPGPREVAELARRLAKAELAAGRMVDAVAVLEEALDAAGDTDRELVLGLEALLAGIRMVLGYAVPGLDRYADLPGDTPAERQLLAILSARYAGSVDRFDLAVEAARRATAGGRLALDGDVDGVAVDAPVAALAAAELHDEAAAYLDVHLRVARERGSVIGTLLARAWRGMVLAHQGDLPAASAELTAIVRMGRDRGWFGASMFSVVLLQVEVERGALAEADDLVAAGVGGWQAPTGRAPAAIGRGLLLLERHRPAEALEEFRAVADLELASGTGVDRQPGWRGVGRLNGWRFGAIRALVELGDLAEARRLADELLELCTRRGGDRPLGAALQHLALTRPPDEALPLFERAVAHLERTRGRLELAHTLVDWGAALRRAGRPADAREPLRRGVELAERCGAARLVVRADEELAATGMRRRRTRSDADELTPSERRVAAMAAEGLTNKQIAQTLFVSLKTVETHLGSAYRKLGVSSRRELAARR